MESGDYVELFVRYLKSQGLHNTAARQLIAESVSRLNGHFDARSVLGELSGEGIAPSTIYRTLEHLVSAGLVRKISLEGKSLYENAILGVRHGHFICSSCGKVIEFDDFALLERASDIGKSKGFRDEGLQVSLLGICSDCDLSN